VKRNQKNRKEMIIQAAIGTFSTKGFNASTISDIAKKVGIAESTIYEYFRGKEDILFSIPEDGMKKHLASLDRHLGGVKGADNKLRKIVWHLFDFYHNNKDYMYIMLRELRANPRFYKSNAYKLMKKYSQVISDIIEEGKEEGVFDKNIDTKVLRAMITGGIDHLTLPLLMLNRPYKMMAKTEAFFDILINALTIKNGLNS
jgi:TetR/AcrR family fatty acid metabolism transcriptional regulator